MLEIIKQLALDAAEKGADFCVGTVTKAALLRADGGQQYLVLGRVRKEG